MNEEKLLPRMYAAKTPGCEAWTRFIPLPGTAVRETATAIPHDTPAVDDALLLADPEGIDDRLAAAI